MIVDPEAQQRWVRDIAGLIPEPELVDKTCRMCQRIKQLPIDHSVCDHCADCLERNTQSPYWEDY